MTAVNNACGQIAEDREFFYHYDCEGNLVFKEFKEMALRGGIVAPINKERLEAGLGIRFRAFGTGWRYDWQSDGMLARVVCPDGKEVSFAYDALGRRIRKSFAGTTTHFVWDGNVPLHEWTEEAEESMVTWLFEQDTFVPAAKLVANGGCFYIVSDYLGTPLQAYDKQGNKVREQELGIYGRQRKRPSAFIPFKYQGQYEDAETGMYYNRFRYYDPKAGSYVSQDPIGVAGGNPTLYGYCFDTSTQIDPFGLGTFGVNQSVYVLYNKTDVVNGVPVEGAKPYYVGISKDSGIRLGQHTNTHRFDPETDVKIDLHKNIDYAKARAYEQYYIEKYGTIDKTNPKTNQQNSFRHPRTDTRGKPIETEYNKIKSHYIMNKIIVNAGDIFCIPLFMPKDDWKLKIKLSDKDLDKKFAFGRVIETSSSVLVEIFKKMGSAKTSIHEIENSGVLFSPLQFFWDGIIKRRWRIIGKTENYDKYKHSNYRNLKMIFGTDDNFRLRDFNTQEEVSITRENFKQYEFSIVWFPIDLENRILKAIQ